MDIDRQIQKDMLSAVEVIPNRLYFVILRNIPHDTESNTFFTVDDTFIYWNFFLDFGPYNLSHVIKFCDIVNDKLEKESVSKRRIYFYTKVTPKNKCNSIFLLASYAIIYLDCNPYEAYEPFKDISLPSYHDASPGECTFVLTVMDCLRGLYKALYYRLFDVSTFDVNEYEYYEKVENGDFNWIQSNRFLAFAGPEANESTADGYYILSPSYYIPYFKEHNVNLVVRFNKPMYDATEFTKHDIKHVDLYYTDGSVPEYDLLTEFITLCEKTEGVIAVHCKAGLGRTGTCIGAYLMKHYHFTAEEVIGYIRICRPGSIIGPQQFFLKEYEEKLWQAGDEYRSTHSSVPGNVDGGSLPLLTKDCFYNVSGESDIDSVSSEDISILNLDLPQSDTSSFKQVIEEHENTRDSLFNSVYSDDIDEILENKKQDRYSSESCNSLHENQQNNSLSPTKSPTKSPVKCPVKCNQLNSTSIQISNKTSNSILLTPKTKIFSDISSLPPNSSNQEHIDQGSSLRIQKSPKKE